MEIACLELRSRTSHDLPAFAREVACVRLDAPFRAGVVVIARGPDEVQLRARIHLPAELVSVPVHWEVTRDAELQQRERYGLIAARAGDVFEVTLKALAPGQPYWYRLWAGGHWSRTGQFMAGLRRRADVTEARRMREARIADSLLAYGPELAAV